MGVLGTAGGAYHGGQSEWPISGRSGPHVVPGLQPPVVSRRLKGRFRAEVWAVQACGVDVHDAAPRAQ